MPKTNSENVELTPSQRDYILEELALLMGCVPEGLTFPLENKALLTQKEPLFIVYPGEEEAAFVEGKRCLEKLANDKGYQNRYDVQWMEVSLNELAIDSEESACSSKKPGPYMAKLSNKAFIQQLFQCKNKRLLFLISIGQPYHKYHCLSATINLFKNIIQASLSIEKEFQHIKNTTRPIHTTGNWQIRIIAADILQAYNEENTQEAREKYIDLGKEWIINEAVNFLALKELSSEFVNIDIEIIDWQNFLDKGKKEFSFEEKYNYLLNTYNKTSTYTSQEEFCKAVKAKGINHQERDNKRKTYKKNQNNSTVKKSSDLEQINNNEQKPGNPTAQVKKIKNLSDFEQVEALVVLSDETLDKRKEEPENNSENNNSKDNDKKPDETKVNAKKAKKLSDFEQVEALVALSDETLDKGSFFQQRFYQIFKQFIYGFNPDDIILQKLENKERILLNEPFLPHHTVQRGKLAERLDTYFAKQPSGIDNSHYFKNINDRLAQSNQSTCEGLIVLSDSGGTGKSHLAAYYFYHSKQAYTFRYWINVTSQSVVFTAYKKLAIALNLPEAINPLSTKDQLIAAVITWLNKNPGWLLIFDDISSYELVKEYLPQKGGHIIITSLTKDWPEGMLTESVGLMDESESVQLLQNICGLTSDYDKAILQEIAKKLDYLPLALIMASAYLNEFMNDQANLLKQEDNILLDKNNVSILLHAARALIKDIDIVLKNRKFIDKDGSKGARPLNITYMLSINAIEKQDKANKRCFLAKELLYFISYLSPHSISLNLIDTWLNQYYPAEVLKEPQLAKRLVKQLVNYSLINELNEETIAIRPVMQIILATENENRFLSTNEFYKQSLDKISNVLYQQYENLENKPFNAEAYESLYTHATNIYNYMDEIKKTTVIDLANIIVRIAYHKIGLYFEAIKYNTILMNHYNKGSDKEKEIAVKCLVAIAQCYGSLGWDQAQKNLLEETLVIIKQEDKFDSKNVGAILILLSEHYFYNAEMFAKAIELLKQAEKIFLATENYNTRSITYEGDDQKTLSNVYFGLSRSYENLTLEIRSIAHNTFGNPALFYALFNSVKNKIENLSHILPKDSEAANLLNNLKEIISADSFDKAIISRIGVILSTIAQYLQTQREYYLRRYQEYDSDNTLIFDSRDNGVWNSFSSTEDSSSLKLTLNKMENKHGKNSIRLYNALIRLGNAYGRENRYQDQELIFFRLIELCKMNRTAPFLLVNSYIFLSNVYQTMGSINKQIETLRYAIHISDHFQNSTLYSKHELLKSMSTVYGYLSKAHNEIGDNSNTVLYGWEKYKIDKELHGEQYAIMDACIDLRTVLSQQLSELRFDETFTSNQITIVESLKKLAHIYFEFGSLYAFKLEACLNNRLIILEIIERILKSANSSSVSYNENLLNLADTYGIAGFGLIYIDMLEDKIDRMFQDPLRIATLKLNFAMSYTDIGEYQKARKLFDQIKYIFQYYPESHLLLRILSNELSNPSACNKKAKLESYIVRMLISCATHYNKFLLDRILKKYPNSIDWQDPTTGKTALHVAIDHKNFEVCELLLSKGAKYTILDNNKRTPFDLALSSQEFIKGISALKYIDNKLAEATNGPTGTFHQIKNLLEKYTTTTQKRVENNQHNKQLNISANSYSGIGSMTGTIFGNQSNQRRENNVQPSDNEHMDKHQEPRAVIKKIG